MVKRAPELCAAACRGTRIKIKRCSPPTRPNIRLDCGERVSSNTSCVATVTRSRLGCCVIECGLTNNTQKNNERDIEKRMLWNLSRTRFANQPDDVIPRAPFTSRSSKTKVLSIWTVSRSFQCVGCELCCLYHHLYMQYLPFFFTNGRNYKNCGGRQIFSNRSCN